MRAGSVLSLTARLCAALLAFAGAASAEPLPDEIVRTLARHKLSADAVSLVVQAVDESTPRLALNVDVPRNPASTIKLVTTWVALDLLGPTHTWSTRLYALGPISDGVLDGDLLIEGGGDPYLLQEDFWRMLGELRRQGVRDIRGGLLVDDSRFAIDENDPGAFDASPFRLYNTLPSALMVNFQSATFSFATEASAGRVTIAVDPELPNLAITNEVRLTQGECRGNQPRIVMQLAAPDARDHVVFSGEMPFACRHYQVPRSVMTPASYAYGTFLRLWPHWGGSITGGFDKATRPRGKTPLVTWPSRPLGEIIRPLNKWSNNLMTRMLLYSLAETRHPAPVTRQQGAAVVREHLAARGLDTSSLVIDNGSGLSRDARLTASFMTALLKLAWREPTMPEFLSSLAIAGRDGTMRKRFRRGDESGRMHLKTGSLDGVAAIAGYVHAPGGRTFVVTVLVNARGARWGAGRELQDALLAWTFRQR